MRRTAALLAAVCLLVATPSAAHAATVDDRDAARDARTGTDIRKVTVDNGRHLLRVRVKLGPTTPRRLDYVELSLNARARNNGPEFRATSAGRNGDRLHGDRFGRVDTWGGRGTRLACRRYTVRYSFARDVVVFRIPHRCFGTRLRRLQVALEAWRVKEFTGDSSWVGWVDYLDARHSWTPWVRRG